MKKETMKQLDDQLSDLREELGHERLIIAAYQEKIHETMGKISAVRRQQLHLDRKYRDDVY